MKLISFQKLGENRESPRLWLESRRLETLGFSAGIPFSIERRVNGIHLRPALHSNNHVSKRISGRQVRPIIDIANRNLLLPLHGFREIKVTAAYRNIVIVPSVRGFHIRRSLEAKAPFRTIEAFCGGGTLSAAIADCKDLLLVAGIELEPKYSDVWQQAYRRTILYQTDIRRVHSTELPAHDILVASIPCTSHSNLGRAKKSLAGKPELGDTGDLYLCVAQIVAHHLLRWTPSFRPLSAENKMGSGGLLSWLFFFVCCSLCALNSFGKERTSRAWHYPSSLSRLMGFQYLPPKAV